MRHSFGKSLLVYLYWHFVLSFAGRSQSRIDVKNITYLGPQISPQLPGIGSLSLSRDGGASVLLSGKVVWLFDDTQVTSNAEELLLFVSNTAAYSHNPDGNLTLLKDFGISMTAGQSGAPGGQSLTIDKALSSGGWIPFTKDESSFNRQHPGKERVAIWPGTNPTPLNIASAILYAPLVCVEAANKTNASQYKAHGVTLITIEAGHARPIASRATEVLFESQDVAYGVFASIVGHGNNDIHLDIYLFGTVTSGLQLARVKSVLMKDVRAYEYLEPATCSFTSTPPSAETDNLSDIYLPGNFSSGSIFHSPFLKTFLLVYFNSKADSTFYARYLDVDIPVCPTEKWIKGGKQGNGIQAEDVEAVYRYAWSSEQVLFRSPPGPKGFNYAGLAHPEFFNNQYYARSSYWYKGISSETESGWFGGGLVGQEQAGGDGRHLLLSWTSQEEGSIGGGRYRVMLAKVEFDDTVQSSTTPSATPPQTGSSPTATSNASRGGIVNAGSSICHSSIWSESWQFTLSAPLLLAFISLVFGLLY